MIRCCGPALASTTLEHLQGQTLELLIAALLLLLLGVQAGQA
jgi:hypothetical protein